MTHCATGAKLNDQLTTGIKYMIYKVMQGRDVGKKKIHADQLTWIEIMKPKLLGKVFIVEFWWHFLQGVFLINQSQGATSGGMNIR